VFWLGPVQSLRQGNAPFFCCEPCIQRLEQLAAAYNSQGPALT
jgi:hypothetical protein